jgi:hypothetical protein
LNWSGWLEAKVSHTLLIYGIAKIHCNLCYMQNKHEMSAWEAGRERGSDKMNGKKFLLPRALASIVVVNCAVQ